MLSYHLINLPIDVTVAKEIVEKGAVEEGCLVLLEKKNAAKHGKTVFFTEKCFSSLFFSVPDCGHYQGLIEKGFARQHGPRLPACGLLEAHCAQRQGSKV